MVSSLAFMLATTLAATPCESLKSVPLPDTTITTAALVPEGPAPQRGVGGGARGAAPAQPPAMIPAHCRVTMVLKPTPDSNIKARFSPGI